MPFTLAHRGAPISGPITSIEGQELLLSLMVTGRDAKVGDKYTVSTSAPAGSITWDAVELEVMTTVRSFLVFRAPTGFAGAGTFTVEITKSAPTPGPTPVATVTVNVTAAPAATPPAAAPTGSTLVVPVSVQPNPLPLTVSVGTAPATTPTTPPPAQKHMPIWTQAALALLALAVVLGFLILAWQMTVGTVVSHANNAAGAALSQTSDPVVIHATGLSVSLGADDLTVTSADPTSATQILNSIQALGATATTSPSPGSGTP